MSRPRKPVEQTTSTLYQGADGNWHAQDFITNLQFPVGMTLGANGELYILDMADGADGSPNFNSRIYRLEYK